MPPRQHIAWIACFAVLFNLLAMPLSSAASRHAAQQLVWGAFCSSLSGPAKADRQTLAMLDKAVLDLTPHDLGKVELHHSCCLGGAPLLSPPSHAPQLRHPPLRWLAYAAPSLGERPTPRQLWPALNPRASPMA
ncbi:DUF2946 family protein [Pseudomonas sp. 22-AL-CL-001]|uniref:DUF2946 family protein n=1 Tax=Pseudomonas alabamensis TaxID=3064349 RepID=UPI0027136276|nr:DUF2946 family protein [Pseudomonas sp. 22-AL-CL-001]MDO7910747.1 DUF2946 family protein [Pseudomonas sp. 22-AL-CL-001]